MKSSASSSTLGNSRPSTSTSSERASLLRQKEGHHKYDSLPFVHEFRTRDTPLIKKFLTWFTSFRIVQLLPSIAAGALIWFLVKPNEDMNVTSIHVLAIFVSTIIALVTTTYEMSVIVLLSLVILVLTRSFTCETDDGHFVECSRCGHYRHHKSRSQDMYVCDGFKSSFSQALSGFSDEITWLVVCAFQLGRAVELTSLGKRLSLGIIRAMGWAGVLGLGYAIAVSELLLGPFVPSNTARGGGIVKPIALSIARALDSTPTRNPEAGRFLMMVGAHSNLISSSFFLTAMAANPLFVSKARAVYPNLELGFFTWLQGSIVPGLVTLAIIPFVLWKMTFRATDDTYDAASVTKHAEIELGQLGKISTKEIRLCFILFVSLILWTTASWTQLPPPLIALAALPLLVLTDILTWSDITTNAAAWDTFIWLGGLTTLAHMLINTGITHHLGSGLSYTVMHFTTNPIFSALVLATLYNLSSIPFTSLSAHIVAFGSVFLGSAKVLGTNPRVVIALIGGFGSLGGATTNFSTGTIAMYFSEAYVSRTLWIATGWLVMVLHLTIYSTIGIAWWWILGWV